MAVTTAQPSPRPATLDGRQRWTAARYSRALRSAIDDRRGVIARAPIAVPHAQAPPLPTSSAAGPRARPTAGWLAVGCAVRLHDARAAPTGGARPAGRTLDDRRLARVRAGPTEAGPRGGAGRAGPAGSPGRSARAARDRRSRPGPGGAPGDRHHPWRPRQPRECPASEGAAGRGQVAGGHCPTHRRAPPAASPRCRPRAQDLAHRAREPERPVRLVDQSQYLRCASAPGDDPAHIQPDRGLVLCLSRSGPRTGNPGCAGCALMECGNTTTRLRRLLPQVQE